MDKRKKIIAIAIGALIVIGGCAVAAYVLLSPDKLIAAAEAGNAKAAVTYYNEHVASNPGKVGEYREIFDETLDKILDDYTKKKIDYEIAESQARVIKALKIMPKADEVYEKIENIHDSRLAIDAGEKALGDGDYKQAIEEFRKATEEKDVAKAGLDEAISKYKEEFASAFDAALKEDDYKKGKELFEEMLEILPDDKDFRSLQEQKIIKLLQYQIESYETQIDNAVELFRYLADFISDKREYDWYSELLTEAYDWAY